MRSCTLLVRAFTDDLVKSQRRDARNKSGVFKLDEHDTRLWRVLMRYGASTRIADLKTSSISEPPPTTEQVSSNWMSQA
jgi:hypothetical protein